MSVYDDVAREARADWLDARDELRADERPSPDEYLDDTRADEREAAREEA